MGAYETYQPGVAGPERDRIESSSEKQVAHPQENPFEDTEPQPSSRPPTNHLAELRGLAATRSTTWNNVWKIFPRWFMTVGLCGCILAVLFSYKEFNVMSRTEKRQFNSIVTGLSIALGFSISSSLNAMVGNLRWWILSRRARSRRKVELILQADSLTHLVKMAWKSHRPSIHIGVFLWLLIIIGSQIAVASLGFCFSVDTAEKHALLEEGLVHLSNMSVIRTNNVVDDGSISLAAQQYAANSFGTISTAYTSGGEYSMIPRHGSIYDPGDPLFWCEIYSCRYIFHETSDQSTESSDLNVLTVNTERSIDAVSSCQAWPVVEGGDGTTTRIKVATDERNITVFVPTAFGHSATVYMVNTTVTCGPGCSIITAFEASQTEPWYYQCNVQVSRVANATIPEHEISDSVATIASSSIALQGYDVLSFNDSVLQHQVYPAESTYGVPMNGSTYTMSYMLSRFTIGALAGIAENSGIVVFAGQEPIRGTKLNITHPRLILVIFLLLIVMQLVLELAVALVANMVVTPDDTPVGLAQVLRGMVAGRTGLEPEYKRNPSSEPLWIYRCPETSEPGIYDLFMEPQYIGHQMAYQGLEMEDISLKTGDSMRQRTAPVGSRNY